MEYLEFKIKCKEEYTEILIAELANLGFDSFLETDLGFDAYIQEDLLEREAMGAVLEKYREIADISVAESKMPKINWNEEWEKNYDPIEVDDRVFVRASFHQPRPEFRHEIVINPKMSFGTGHHATTFLMLSHQLNLDHQNKSVLDIGSGTGILAIMAHKLGAGKIQAFDVDDWCVENGNENFELNGMVSVKMDLGTVRQIKPKGPFDIVLANINKNVLLDEMEDYVKLVQTEGNLLLSGFYKGDVEDILETAQLHKMELVDQKEKDRWVALVLKKKK